MLYYDREGDVFRAVVIESTTPKSNASKSFPSRSSNAILLQERKAEPDSGGGVDAAEGNARIHGSRAHTSREADASAGNVGERTTTPPGEASPGVRSREAGTDTGARGHPAHASGTLDSRGEGRDERALRGGVEPKAVAGGATTTFEERTMWAISAVSDAYTYHTVASLLFV